MYPTLSGKFSASSNRATTNAQLPVTRTRLHATRLHASIDPTDVKNVSLSVNGACVKVSSTDDDSESDRYTTLTDIQAKLDEIDRTGARHSFD